MITPTIQAKIEQMPVSQWKQELQKIEDKEVRERVRNHLKTVYQLQKRKYE